MKQKTIKQAIQLRTAIAEAKNELPPVGHFGSNEKAIAGMQTQINHLNLFIGGRSLPIGDVSEWVQGENEDLFEDYCG